MINIRKLEAELWESADLLRQGSKLTSNQYCMPVLALLFLRYAYSRYKMVASDFHERMNEIHAELAKLNQETNVLMEEIQKTWEELK